MQKLSQRQYAKTIGVSHWAVGKAIRAGHIKRGFDKKQRKINVSLANKEWGNKIKEKKFQGKSISVNAPFDETNLTEQYYRSLGETLSFIEARLRKEIYDAEMARIEALRLKRLYIEKDVTYSTLSAFRITIRSRLQAIPDKYIDKIISAKTRFDAHNILTNAINDALIELSSSPEIN